MPDRGEILERYTLDPARTDPDAPALGGVWDYFASFYIVCGRLFNGADLFGELASVPNRWPGRVVGGLSEPALPGLAVRLAARTAVDLVSAQTALWDITRRRLLGLPIPRLRKY